MLSVLDDSIGNLTQALKMSGMFNNSIVVFTTDNGGPADGFSMNYASNYPLRYTVYITHWTFTWYFAAILASLDDIEIQYQYGKIRCEVLLVWGDLMLAGTKFWLTEVRLYIK